MSIIWRTAARAAAVVLAVAAAGCFSVDAAYSPAADSEQVLVSNNGWWLFNCIPLCCGNATPEPDRAGPFAFFRNDVTLDKVQHRFMEYAHARGASVQDLVYNNYDNVLFGTLHILELEVDGETYGIYFPAYELDAVKALLDA